MINLPPEPDLLLLLHDVARLLRLEIDRRARAQGMNRAQWTMLIKLARHPGLSQKDLAELLEVEPMTVARLTDRLAARGLVERRADPSDRRIWRLHLTAAADPLLDEIEVQRNEVAALIGRDASAPTIAAMIEGLTTIKGTLLADGRCGNGGGGAGEDTSGRTVGRKTPAAAEQEMA